MVRHKQMTCSFAHQLATRTAAKTSNRSKPEQRNIFPIVGVWLVFSNFMWDSRAIPIGQIFVLLCLSGAIMLAQNAGTPRFEDYRVTEIFKGTPAEPILATAEHRRYRTRIGNGVLKGEGVVADTETNRRATVPQTNFAGKYVVVIWGCGSQCAMMATVDAETGKIYDPPLSDARSELYVPLDMVSDMHIGFRRDSSLLVLRNACQDFKNRKTCGTYYFNWKDNHFDLVKFEMAGPLKELVP